MLDLSRWLAPLDGDNPSGANLRDDPRFHELERLAEPQVRIERDDRNNPSAQSVVPVDWSNILSRAEELSVEGRDLRLLVLVARASANERGLGGLAEGLSLIARSIDEHWDTMHPLLRPGGSGPDAALRRINALLQLQNDQDGLLQDLRQKVFFQPRGIGAVSGRDLERGTLDERAVLAEAASGLNTAERAQVVSAHEQLVNRVRIGCTAFADQNTAEMDELVADARASLRALDTLDAALSAKLGASKIAVPDLKRFLERVLATLERGAASAPAKALLVENNVTQLPSARPVPAPASVPEAPAMMATGFPTQLATRDDVIKCLELVVGFYERTEPSSPIPHLARRIRRMVPMDFVELMEDLAPSGLKEFRTLAGLAEGKKAGQKDER